MRHKGGPVALSSTRSCTRIRMHNSILHGALRKKCIFCILIFIIILFYFIFIIIFIIILFNFYYYIIYLI